MDKRKINTFLQQSDTSSTNKKNNKTLLKEQDIFLPIANVSKIMKKDLPVRAKIAKESKHCIQECASEFISFITSEAIENCQKDNRKTLNGEDILISLVKLGFENYLDPLKDYLLKYREASKVEDALIDSCTEMRWSSGSSAVKENQSPQPVRLKMPKLMSLLPLTDLTSGNLNLENLLRDPLFQRSILNHLKMSSIDEDYDGTGDDL